MADIYPEYPAQTAQVVADPKRPWKAIASAVGAAAFAFGSYWIADQDPFTAKEAGDAALLALAASGITGGATYRVTNPTKYDS